MAVEARIGIGHNGGPPLEVTWSAWLWRRAHAAAWKTPPREVAMLRIRRAERLGLSYRDYTAVLMDRGVHMEAIVFAPGCFDPARPAVEVREKLAALGDCRVLVCLAKPGPIDLAVRERAEAVAPVVEPKALPAAIADFMRQIKRSPALGFMVGSEIWHERAAEEAGLSLFKPARDYFGAAVRQPR